MSDAYPLYGGLPPHVAGSDTSEAAALSVVGSVATIRRQVYELLVWQPMTDDELEQRTGYRHQTVSARRRELVLLGFVEDSQRRALTRSGRSATVWRPCLQQLTLG